MLRRRRLATAVVLLASLAAPAKQKKKPTLPPDILHAQSVLVVIDPDAGTDALDPNANRTAQENVEKALLKWGRFSLAQEAGEADLIITIRTGNGRIVQPAVVGLPSNNRPAIFEPTDSGVRIGGRQGTSGASGDPSDPQSPTATRPHPQIQAGESKDAFVVYRCNSKDDPNWDPLESPPIWRYSARNALQAPDVTAVEAFHDIIAETEKQQAAKKP